MNADSGRMWFNELRGIRHALCTIAGKEPAQTLGDAPGDPEAIHHQHKGRGRHDQLAGLQIAS
jgi:hypothetical protein